jgi:hypothetical protein
MGISSPWTGSIAWPSPVCGAWSSTTSRPRASGSTTTACTIWLATASSSWSCWPARGAPTVGRSRGGARLIGIAFAGIGVFADDLADHADLEAPPAIVGETAGVEVRLALAELAPRDERAALVSKAIDRVITQRDALVWLEVLSESAAGNTSPSVTVAECLGLSAVNVRKICQRVRSRLQRLASEDESFSALLHFEAVAA